MITFFLFSFHHYMLLWVKVNILRCKLYSHTTLFLTLSFLASSRFDTLTIIFFFLIHRKIGIERLQMLCIVTLLFFILFILFYILFYLIFLKFIYIFIFFFILFIFYFIYIYIYIYFFFFFFLRFFFLFYLFYFIFYFILFYNFVKLSSLENFNPNYFSF